METRPEALMADPRPTEELIAQLLDKDLDEDHDAWDLITVLQYRFPTVFPHAVRLADQGLQGRKVAALIVGQKAVHDLEGKEMMLGAECVHFLEELLREEKDPGVIVCSISALAHLDRFDSLRLILPYAKHPDRDIRWEVAVCLACFTEKEAISALTQLSVDQDYDTRNWATFGLRLSEVDHPELRDALYARLTEADDTIRGEALVGLAVRLDFRVIRQMEKEIPLLAQNALNDPSFAREAGRIILKHRKDLGPDWTALLGMLDESTYFTED